MEEFLKALEEDFFNLLYCDCVLRHLPTECAAGGQFSGNPPPEHLIYFR